MVTVSGAGLRHPLNTRGPNIRGGGGWVGRISPRESAGETQCLSFLSLDRLALFHSVWVKWKEKDTRYVRSDIGGFSLPESFFEGNDKETVHSGILYNLY